MTGAVRVAAYCRVSTDSDDQRNSLASQRRYFEEYIEQNPAWQLVGIYADAGVSGTSTKKRKQFQALLDRAERGELDLILTKEVSRFARNTVDTLAITRRLKACGVGVLFLTDRIDTRDNDGEFRLTLLASVAQEESRKTSERVRWGQRRQMERGVVFGNNSIYGFDLRDGKLTVKPDEGAVVRQIFEKYTVEGKGAHTIARELTEAGIAPPRRKQGGWTPATVLRILRNEKYKGDLLQKKFITKDYLTHKKTPNDGSEEQIYRKNNHEAIVSPALFEQTRLALEQRARLGAQQSRYSDRHWCSGKICCGGCGSRFVLRRNRRANGAVYQSWMCRAQVQHPGAGTRCSMKTVNDRTLQACMGYLFGQLGLDTGAIARRLAEKINRVQAISDEEVGAWAAELLTAPEVWREAVEQITVSADHLTIKLYGSPQPWTLCYTTGGRGETYRTEIVSCTPEGIQTETAVGTALRMANSSRSK